MPEYSGPGHKIVAIDMSFPCRQFDRLMASDPSVRPMPGTHDCNRRSEPLHANHGSLRENPSRATGQTMPK